MAFLQEEIDRSGSSWAQLANETFYSLNGSSFEAKTDELFGPNRSIIELLHFFIPNRHYEYQSEKIELSLFFKVLFYVLYGTIFVVGLSGNILICYVVFKQTAMHSVTNIFIANLAMADILLCLFAIPFTPLYLLVFEEWIFGNAFCHLVPFAQGMSVYISIFTLMSIAIERYMVIVHPFQRHFSLSCCGFIICGIWLCAFCLTLPYGIFIGVMEVVYIPRELVNQIHQGLVSGAIAVHKLNQQSYSKSLCDELWPNDNLRLVYGITTCIIQFVIPFCIITFCYLKVCLRLWDRVQSRPGSRNCSSQRKWFEKERAKRTNIMLIAMVVIFALTWSPLNTYNLIEDFYVPVSRWPHRRLMFMMFHVLAMSSTCYNPFLYAWLNDNFRKEFRCIFAPVCNRLCWLFLGRNSEMLSGKEMRSSATGPVGWRRAGDKGGALVGALTNHHHQLDPTNGENKDSTRITRLDPVTGEKIEDEGECISLTMLDTTTNLVTNLESINEAELQESLFVTSVRHNGTYTSTLLNK